MLYMTRKIKNTKDSFVLPSNNKELEFFIRKNKTLLTESTIQSIEFGIKHNLPVVEVFNFDKSDYVITISSKDYLVNLEHIYKFYLESENYELCSDVVRIQTLLKKQIKSNEKKIEIEIDNPC